MLCEDKKCVGCFACSAVCPVGAIHFCEDNRGFLKPQIDDSVCINCKKCDSVCPALKNVSKQISLNIYAAQNKNQDERMESSSGGLFSVFAQKILEGGGAVLGVSFDKDKKVKHILIEKKEHLEDLRGSKYVQSNLSDCYLELKKWLDSGKKVLFSGTPCQVAAVKKYAGDNCENLITCDLVCHGVPSPKIFGQAIELYEKTYGAKVSACNFRKKFPSWNLFSMEMVFENGKRHLKTKDADPYLKGFLESLFLRESCYNCSYADVKRVSDITLADFWGYIHDNDVIQDNNTGISLVMVNSEKGRSLFEAIKDEIVYVEKTIQEAKKENYCLINSFDKPENYYSFWKDYETKKFDEVCKKYLSVNGKLYLDAKETNAKFDEITVIPSDAVGSKGDEAMLRGMLNLFNGKKIRMLTPRRELWKGWLIDRNEDYTEQYVELEELKNTIKKPTHLVIIGADIMDGLYGSRDTMTRLEAAERVIDLGGRVDIFSCSFRMEVSEDIIRKIINIGERLHFHFRDDQSLNNFKKQTSLEADYFPDLAFLCEKTLSGKSEEVNQQIRVKKAGKKIIFGINFCEHACRGFYNEPSLKQRKEYIASVIDQIDSVLGNQVFYVLIPHDTKYWDGHYSDEEYAKWAMEYIIQKHSSDSVLCVNNYMTETELLSILPELDMIVSGRMHLDIAAIRSGVIPIAYMGNCQTTSYRNIEKFKGMFTERIGHSDLVSGSEEEFTFSLKKAIKDNDGIKTSILERNRIKNADMLELVNQFRSKIGLSQFKKDVDVIHYTQGNMTTTVAYIAELSVNYKRQQEYVKQQRDQIYQINQKAEEEQLVLKTELENKKAHIELLLQSERDLKNELEALRNSRTWRMAFFLHKPVVWCLPEGSKRRLLVKIICKLFRHPVRAFKMLSPRKIRHFLYYLKEEGPGFVAKRIDESMQGISVQSMKLDMVTLDENKPFDEYDKLTFSKTEQPDVSIIIPVYNQFAYTYHCLQSILNHTGTEVTYEVIIANDCSSDETTRLGEIVENVHIITNEQNLRFLKNCNHAAEFANGKYILFLNNDTQAQKDWLAPLVRLMESSQNIGMVGSKLIYANGMLQEAGGIVWKDASAWNYGNRSNPTNPEYNYVKEADYISGAAIMIRSSLWKEIGGFDENFAPAYYEDTDLAFEVRKHGYKVLYQPLSAVIHFEGISNGTDISSGQKSYQITNQKKFQKKWKNVLMEENYGREEKAFLAKDRSGRKKTLLMVDHYVPMYDKDAGSRCMFYYLNLFVNMGYNVKFIGDNFYKHEPYTTTLQQMGVEVLYGDYYYNNWKEWLKSNGKYFDYVFLSRPHISIKYIDAVREYTKAKIIYFGHDLHYLREMREYELTGNEQSLKDSKDWKKTELELMRKADVSYYLSNVELAEIAKVDPTVKVRRVPINIYTDIPDIHYQAENRKDIIFVGGFGHPPNIDAVKWLGEEIMPKVWEKNSEIVLHVVGSKPPKEIQAFSSERMIIHGFVSDEDLEEMYQNVKLAIVPLRFGAGIKGKIIEAMMRGIPMITTSIGIEGIEGAENIAKISDDADELAEFISEIYGNENELEKMAAEEHQYIIDNYSMKNAVEILGQDFIF